jgi:hypothetical protein
MALKRSAVRFRLAPPVFSKSWLKNYFKWAISSIALVLVLCIGGLIGLFACLVSDTFDDTIPTPVTNVWRYHRGAARGRCIGSTESTWRISAKSPPYLLRSIKPGRSISLLHGGANPSLD